MLYIIDGTGVDHDATYEKIMKNGFCKRIEFEYNGRYMRGPTLTGRNTFDIANSMLEFIKFDIFVAKKESKPVQPIFLAGHSRGGAAVIRIAEMLKEIKIEVEAMFLFDAVDRIVSLTQGTSDVPSNVKKCYHALRDQGYANRKYAEQLAAAKKAEIDSVFFGSGNYQQLQNQRKQIEMRDKLFRFAMRTEFISLSNEKEDGPTERSIPFGNTGLKPDNIVEKAYFEATHGAMGGSPILKNQLKDFDHGLFGTNPHELDKFLVQEDEDGMRAVKTWMWGQFAKSGMNLCYI